MNQRGFTMIEVLIASALGIVVVLLFASAVISIQRTGRIFTTKSDIESEVTRLSTHIIRTGRLASICTTENDVLTCIVDEGSTVTPTFSQVRWRVENEVALYELNTGDQATPVWAVQLRFPGIQSITLCDDSAMYSDSCSVEPVAMSNSRRDLLQNLEANAQTEFLYTLSRFFRFRVRGTATIETTNGGTAQTRNVEIGGAFFTRNTLGIATLAYRWGSKD